MAATPKLNYRVRLRLEVFYTGGAVRLSHDGKLLACACGDEVKVIVLHMSSTVLPVCMSPTLPLTMGICMQVVDIATGSVLKTFPGVRAHQHWMQRCLQKSYATSAAVFFSCRTPNLSQLWR